MFTRTTETIRRWLKNSGFLNKRYKSVKSYHTSKGVTPEQRKQMGRDGMNLGSNYDDYKWKEMERLNRAKKRAKK